MHFSLGILLSLCFIPTITATDWRIIFGARCEARCFAKSKELLSPCNGTCHQACKMPCEDADFYKVKSCTQYCRKWFNNFKSYKECKISCKLLMGMYNKGGHQAKQNQFPKKLPETPTGVNSSLMKRKQQHKMLIKWSYNYSRANSQVPVFIVETKYYKQKPFFQSEWTFLLKTNETSIQITPKPKAWSEYRVMAINQYGNGSCSTSTPPIYVMPDKPSPPRDFRVDKMIRKKDKVSVYITWSKPLTTELPVHRYRLFWSPRLDVHTKQFHSLRVHHKKIKGDVHSYILNELNLNTTYVLELQANCHFKGERLRSKKVKLRIRTLDKAQKEVSYLPVKALKKKKNVKKKTMQNSIKATGIQPTKSSKVVTYSINKRLPTKGLEYTIQGQKSHNAAETITIRAWLCFVSIATALVL